MRIVLRKQWIYMKLLKPAEATCSLAGADIHETISYVARAADHGVVWEN